MVAKKKRSQVTIFLILGIVLFVILLVILATNKDSAENLLSREVTRANERVFNAQPIKKLVEECLSIISKDGLKKVGNQAGYLFISQGGPIADYTDLEEGKSFVNYNNFKVAFGAPNEPKLKKELGQNSIQEQLAVFAMNNIDNCLDFSAFETQGFKISKKDKAINANIGDEDITFLMNYQIILENPSTSERIEIKDFFIRQGVRMARIYSFVNQLVGRKEILQGTEGDFVIQTERDAANKNEVVIVTDKKSHLGGLPYSYVFAKRANNGALGLVTGAAISGFSNNIPTADAGRNRNVNMLKEAKLFGSGDDADGDAITFIWQMIDKPGGSASALLRENTPNPSFVPDLQGDYKFRLRTTDGKSFSNISTVTITSKPADTTNIKPKSYPGISRNANVGQKTTLAGFGVDKDGNQLNYMWNVLTFPGNGHNWLSNSNVQSPVFIPNVAGTYTFSLTINDGKEDSDPTQVTITASAQGTNRAPSADPGYDRTVKTGDIVNILGTGSDPDNNPLTFLWAIVTKPSGSIAVLSNTNIQNPTFTPDLEGNYIFSLAVNDGQLDSAVNTVNYTAKTIIGNNKPVADAGLNGQSNLGEETELQGTGSDQDRDTLSYRWSILSMPAGAGLSLSNPNSQNPKFTPTVKGEYIFNLIVNDGKEDSGVVFVIIIVVEPSSACSVEGACDITNKKWCSNGQFISEGYCGHCSSQDNTCLACTGNVCDITNKKWCDSGAWTNGTYSQYCAHCSYADTTCPLCSAGTCDVSNRKWCNNAAWSVIDYCINCGSVDSYCKNTNVTCKNGVCDTKNNEWCNNGKWNSSDYCTRCGKEDSSCFFKCSNNECDITNKKWCDNGEWSQNNYCSHCGSKDFSCGLTCQNNVCDTISNKWCNSGSWESLNYCEHCQDSDCLNNCINNACDVNPKKWCNNRSWTSNNYCSNCGGKDSSCSFSCEGGICDTTGNKRCLNSSWVSTNYCDNCALVDSDCTILCAEGECDRINKKACNNGVWTETFYASYCAAPINLPNITSTNITRYTCNNYQNCTINSPCVNNTECSSRFCLNNKCTQPTCNDAVIGGNETDIDCGGSCSKCINGKKCNVEQDCISSFCSSGLCAENSCNDKTLSGNETDIDCGGLCENKCKQGKNCIGDNDCEPSLVCASNICSEVKNDSGTIPQADSDGDRIPNEWELKYGLNSLNSLDADMDLDEEGLTNRMEYQSGTSPINPDSDNDGSSDKNEIDNGTDPLDPLSKIGSTGGVLFVALMAIIIFGAGSYFVYYYIDYLKPWEDTKPGTIPMARNFLLKLMPPKPPIKATIIEKETIESIVKRRRAEKEEKRQNFFGSFSKDDKTKKPEPLVQQPSGALENKKNQISKNPNDDVFSRLKSIPKK